MILVLGPNVPHSDDRAVALDRPPRLLGGRLERRLMLPRSKPSGNVTSNGSAPSGRPRLATRQPYGVATGLGVTEGGAASDHVE
jgi:hypothetical protein